MSKQAKMFKDWLELPIKLFLWTMAEYQRNPNMFTQDESIVIESLLAFAQD